jgi:hypothetical protein
MKMAALTVPDNGLLTDMLMAAVNYLLGLCLKSSFLIAVSLRFSWAPRAGYQGCSFVNMAFFVEP